MNSPTNKSFGDVLRPTRGYFVSDVRLEIPNPKTAIFKARLNGPEGKPAWARAWLSTEEETLAEAASPEMRVGDEVILEAVLRTAEEPSAAYMRIESAPLETEHVVGLKFGVNRPKLSRKKRKDGKAFSLCSVRSLRLKFIFSPTVQPVSKCGC
jgi:hypothetical protein